jgi:hypothetical protein
MPWRLWNLVDRHGYNANIYDSWSTGGNNLAVQLVMDGMKFQPCSPGFVDGRNAILAADTALTGGVNRCEIWRGFAKRGLGVSANQGLSTNRTDGTEAFDLPASCTAATFGAFHPPIEAAPTLNEVNAGATVPVKFTLAGAGASLLMTHRPSIAPRSFRQERRRPRRLVRVPPICLRTEMSTTSTGKPMRRGRGRADA